MSVEVMTMLLMFIDPVPLDAVWYRREHGGSLQGCRRGATKSMRPSRDGSRSVLTAESCRNAECVVEFVAVSSFQPLTIPMRLT
jgi:hypothetical protein